MIHIHHCIIVSHVHCRKFFIISQNARIEHPCYHRDMRKYEKYSDKYRMKFERISFSCWSSDDSHIHECNADKRNNSEEIKSNRNYISYTAPCSCGREWNNSSEEKVEKYSHKIHSASNSSNLTECCDGSSTISCEEDIEFCDSNGFREDNGNCHKKDEIPGLVAREEFHVVSHLHR